MSKIEEWRFSYPGRQKGEVFLMLATEHKFNELTHWHSRRLGTLAPETGLYHVFVSINELSRVTSLLSIDGQLLNGEPE